MSNSPRVSSPRPAPVSIRFSDFEKAYVREMAGGLPLGTYIKRVVLGVKARPNPPKQPIPDAKALGQILGFLGRSRVANNLNQLAKAVNLGALPVDKETEADIKSACAEIAMMRTLLMAALGRKLTSGVTREMVAEFVSAARRPGS